jgi:ABC-2 type transport system ATP-binding protein
MGATTDETTTPQYRGNPMNDASPAIQTHDLGRRYGRRWVVEDLNLRVERGAVYGLLGLNGSGKSTTMHMLMGLIRPHTGRAEVLGLDVQRKPVEVKTRTGYVAETPNFYEWMTIDEICGFVAHYRKDWWDWKRADHLLNRFRLDPKARIRTLSKGQKAKTSLLLAMAFNPELLILDEPTSGLDPVARREFIEVILAEYQESGRTILITSHLISELSGLVDQVGVLHEGRLIRSTSAEDFTQSVKRVRLFFDGETPQGIACDSMINLKANGREATLTVGAFDEARTREQLQRFGPAKIEVQSLNLEDAFVETVGAADRENA